MLTNNIGFIKCKFNDGTSAATGFILGNLGESNDCIMVTTAHTFVKHTID